MKVPLVLVILLFLASTMAGAGELPNLDQLLIREVPGIGPLARFQVNYVFGRRPTRPFISGLPKDADRVLVDFQNPLRGCGITAEIDRTDGGVFWVGVELPRSGTMKYMDSIDPVALPFFFESVIQAATNDKCNPSLSELKEFRGPFVVSARPPFKMCGLTVQITATYDRTLIVRISK